MAEASERARHAAMMSLARDLKGDLAEAERWCDAWEGYAARRGVARGRYFWDSARGWIDAQRTFVSSPPADGAGVAAQVTRVARVDLAAK